MLSTSYTLGCSSNEHDFIKFAFLKALIMILILYNYIDYIKLI